MTIEDDIAFLNRVPTLHVLGRDALRILAIGSESRVLRAGEILFNLGDVSDAGYIVQEGRLLLKSGAGSARREIVVGPGALIGEHALLAETRRPVSAAALEPSVVLRISRSLFVKMLEGFPEAALRLRESLVARTINATRDIVSVKPMLDRDKGKTKK